MKKISIFLLLFLSLTACSNDRDEAIYPSDKSKQIEEVLNKQDAINGYKSVMNQNDVLVAIDIKRLNRFQKEKIEKKVAKQLEKSFPDKEVIVTGDLKIRWEIEAIIDKQLKNEDLTDSIEKIKSLSKEET